MKIPQFLAIAALSAAWPQAQSACNLSFAYNAEPSPPYMVGEGTLPAERPGVAVEMVREASRRIGCTARFVRLPNVRVLAETQAGRHDGAFMYSHNAERAAGLAYPLKDGKPDHDRRIATLRYYLYRQAGSPVEWDGQRLRGLNGAVGVNLGWSIGRDLKAMGIAVEEALGSRSNLEKLLAGRIAAYATQDLAGDAAVQRWGQGRVERLPAPLSTKDYFVVFNPDFAARERETTERFWSALAELREEMAAKLLPLYAE